MWFGSWAKGGLGSQIKVKQLGFGEIGLWGVKLVPPFADYFVAFGG